MNITILTAGTSGDIFPYVQLGKTLCDLGHYVSITASRRYAGFFEETAVNLHAIDDPFGPEEADNSLAPLLMTQGTEFVKKSAARAKPSIPEFLKNCFDASQNSDLIIYGNLGFAAPHISDATAIPIAAVSLTPTFISSEYPAFKHYTLKNFESTTNRLSHLYSEYKFWESIRNDVNDWRKNSLGIKSGGVFGPLGRYRRSRTPYIYTFSRKLLKRPNDWPAHVHQTNYLYEKINSPYDSNDFPVNRKRRTACASYGPAWGAHPERRLRTLYRLTKNLGLDLVLIGCPSTLRGKSMPDDVTTVDYASYHHVFSKSALVFHHGGAGATHYSLLYDVPTVTTPSFGDQFFWSNALEHISRACTLDIDSMAIEEITRRVAMLMLLDAQTDENKNLPAITCENALTDTANTVLTYACST